MDQELARERYERSHDPRRLIALSDGVFAIVLTLMVLEIHVPTDQTSLTTALRQIRPSVIAFLISFAIVGISWMAHRDLFSNLRLTDRNLVWLNTLYLLPLSVVPFGAALLAQYEGEKVPVVLYGVLVVALALTRMMIWLYATKRPHLLYEPIDPRSRRTGVVIVVVPLAMYIAAILLAGVSRGKISIALYAAVPVLYFVAALLIKQAPPGSVESELT